MSHRGNSLRRYDIERAVSQGLSTYAPHIRLLFLLFLVNLLVYGQKLVGFSLAPDDYQRFLVGSEHQSAWNGRWLTGFAGKYLLGGVLHILPYFNAILGIFSVTLAGYGTALFFGARSSLRRGLITLLCSATPFIAHNFYWSTNAVVWITIPFAVFGVYAAYQKGIKGKIIGLALLVLAIGAYQTALQLALAMILFRTLFDIMHAQNGGGSAPACCAACCMPRSRVRHFCCRPR